MKKYVCITLAFLLIRVSAFAQSPEKISYQAVIRNSNNTLVSNQQVGMQISILQGSVNGSVVYEEVQISKTNANGLISIQVGAGLLVVGDFAAIDWENGPYFIKTETDINGGTDYTISGVIQLMSVPYALYAKTSGSSMAGPQGADGKSAYQIAVDGGYRGTIVEWLVSLKGADGEQGVPGEKGVMPSHEWDGTNLRFQNDDGSWGDYTDIKGLQGVAGANGMDGSDGKSAYQIALDDGYSGTQAEWLASLKGADGEQGVPGEKGVMPSHEWDGTSLRFQHSDGSWGNYADLKGSQGVAGVNGEDGSDGKSAYQIAVDGGYSGTQAEWLVSLKGANGAQGVSGEKGDIPSHQWSGTSIRFQNANGTWGNYVDLKGTPGPAVRTVAMCIKNVDSRDRCSNFCSGGVVAGSGPVKWYKTGVYTNCGSCRAMADVGSCSASSCAHDGYVICCVCKP